MTAALTSGGEPVTETVEKVLAATRGAAVGDPDHGKWNWGMERRELERMCFDLVTKKFREEGIDLSHTLPDELYSQWQARLKEGKRPVITRNGSGVHVRGFGGDPPPQSLSAQAVNGNGSGPARTCGWLTNKKSRGRRYRWTNGWCASCRSRCSVSARG